MTHFHILNLRYGEKGCLGSMETHTGILPLPGDRKLADSSPARLAPMSRSWACGIFVVMGIESTTHRFGCWPGWARPRRALASAALAVAACLGPAAASAQPLPAVSAPAKAEVATLAALGRQLFFDKSLSTDASVSCASCHQQEKAFSDGRRVALGVGNRAGLRNSPSLLNVGHHRAFFWDGRATSLEQQVLEPLTNPNEHGFSKLGELLTRLREQAPYKAAFNKAFAMPGTEAIRAETVAAALAAFVRSLVSPESAIDRFVLKGDKTALNAEARAGLELFRGRAQCASCHLLNDDAGTGRVQLSDQQFHAHGQLVYPMQAAVRSRLAAGSRPADFAKANPGEASSFGRFMVTGSVEDVGAFKTPSLRNVALTAPYFHDGSAETLEQAVNRELLGKTSEIKLSAAETRQLLAFLRALVDDPSK